MEADRSGHDIRLQPSGPVSYQPLSFCPMYIVSIMQITTLLQHPGALQVELRVWPKRKSGPGAGSNLKSGAGDETRPEPGAKAVSVSCVTKQRFQAWGAFSQKPDFWLFAESSSRSFFVWQAIFKSGANIKTHPQVTKWYACQEYAVR